MGKMGFAAPNTKAGNSMKLEARLQEDVIEIIAKVLELEKENAKLQARCDRLQEEINSLENPPHQLCGHSAGNCKC
jgi:peptidoglycan hydrolase CwlO-like protein